MLHTNYILLTSISN